MVKVQFKDGSIVQYVTADSYSTVDDTDVLILSRDEYSTESLIAQLSLEDVEHLQSESHAS